MEKVTNFDCVENKSGYGISMLIAAYSFLRWPLQQQGIPGLKAVAIFAEERNFLEIYLTELSMHIPSESLVSLNSQKIQVKNFEAGIHILRQTEKDVALENFLHREDFLPVLGISGTVPKFVLDEAYVLKVDQHELIMIQQKTFSVLVNNFMMYSAKEIDFLMKQIRNYWQMKGGGNAVNMFTLLFEILGEFVLNYFASRNEGEIAGKFSGLFQIAIEKQRQFQMSWEELDGVTEVVAQLFHKYVAISRNIVIADVKEIEEQARIALDERRAILYDEEYYYLPSELFAAICQEITETVSLPKLTRCAS